MTLFSATQYDSQNTVSSNFQLSPSMHTHNTAHTHINPRKALLLTEVTTNTFGVKSPKAESSIIECHLLVLFLCGLTGIWNRMTFGTGQENQQDFP